MLAARGAGADAAIWRASLANNAKGRECLGGSKNKDDWLSGKAANALGP